MDVPSYIALIVFGIIVLAYFIYMQVAGHMPKMWKVETYTSHEILKWIPFYILFACMTVVPIIIGLVGLFK